MSWMTNVRVAFYALQCLIIKFVTKDDTEEEKSYFGHIAVRVSSTRAVLLSYPKNLKIKSLD